MSHSHRPVRSQVWECPHCAQRIIVHVRLTAAPVCSNRSSHGTKAVVMVRPRNVR
jgi:DNA-directed RNA polymerase subunit RPC12/RpoP